MNVKAIAPAALAVLLSGCAGGVVYSTGNGPPSSAPQTASARTCQDVQALTRQILAAPKLPGSSKLHAWFIDSDGITGDLHDDGLLAATDGSTALDLQHDLLKVADFGQGSLVRLQQDARALDGICHG